MDVFKLDANFDPDVVIENYESVAWTERYYTSGEFQLTTYAVEEAITLLPMNAKVSLSVSNQVMIVEEHLIETDDKGIDVLKITGRSVDGLLDTKWLLGGVNFTFPGEPPRVRIITPAKTTELAVRDLFSSASDFMVTGFSDSGQGVTNHINLFSSAEVVGLGPEVVRYVKPGTYEKFVREILSEIDASIRSDRTYPASAGIIAVIIYKGRDLRENPAIEDYVIFSVDNGDFKKVSYLRSLKNYKNVAYYMAGPNPLEPGDSGYKSVSLPLTIPATISGFERRVLYVDTVPFYNEETGLGADSEAGSLELALAELRKHQRTLFITAEISDALKDQYNVTYALGDLVTFKGKYGITTSMQITEFTRIQDVTGERAYPTLTEVPLS